MNIRLVLVVTVLSLVLTLVLAACGGAQKEAAPAAGEAALDGKALAEERCVKCHDYGRVEVAKKGLDGWKATVARMVDHGAELNEGEQQAVVDHLAEAYPE
jgi:cytochrome c5